MQWNASLGLQKRFSVKGITSARRSCGMRKHVQLKSVFLLLIVAFSLVSASQMIVKI